MPTADATISTNRASRYLTQLCRHLNQMSRMRHRPAASHSGQAPPAVDNVDWSDTAGTIRFSTGTCTLQATPDTLTLRVDADDEDALNRLQQSIARRLETIGRRDRLTVHWGQPDSTSGRPAEEAAAAAIPGRRRRLGSTLVLLGLVVLAVVVHLGLLGGALAASPWASWGTTIVVAIILVKVIAVGVHVILGRMAFRHRGTFLRRRHGRVGVPAATADRHEHPS
ncbi:DUF2218 domain-containing protein [Amycolatopsis thermophila]|uniref:DUF2218 domain-containing protein n=1 Tax=Amycolatopsis thermophila TaxID=206084 RepID=A0ABU0F357_9PSEU|nr:DUF2218 domain-containing protein [Amycolatopsis thermophila]MDQ0381987.1 hypothetical protein [Amycolatopsis thermophila]